MKNILFFTLFLFLTACNKDENGAVEQPTASGITLFDKNEIPLITLEFELADWNKLLENYDLNPKNDKKVVSKFSIDNNQTSINLDSIGLKLRGNTSRRRPEGSYGEMHNATNPDWHHCHFGLDFSKYKNQRVDGRNKLVLKWFKDDSNYVREIYSYDLFERFGIWTAPKASYCRVQIKIKGDANPAYYGVYEMIESVDEDFIAKRQQNWTNQIGFLWKAGWSGSDNADFVHSTSIGVEDVKLNPANSLYYAYDLKTREDEIAAAKTDLQQFIADLNSKNDAEFQTWINQKMDIDLFLKTYATNVVLGMWDDYWVNGNNFYFYFAGNGKAYFIPYDYDNTLGTSLLMNNSGKQNPLYWGNLTERPLVTKILAIPEYRTIYKNYVKELINPANDLFDATKSRMRIMNWQSKIAPYVSNDTNEDMIIEDKPASWGNQPNYRLLSGNSEGGTNGEANYFLTRASSIPW